MNELARTAGAPAVRLFTREASLAEKPRVSPRGTTISTQLLKGPVNYFRRPVARRYQSVSIRGLIGLFLLPRLELSTLFKHEPERGSSAAQSAILL